MYAFPLSDVQCNQRLYCIRCMYALCIMFVVEYIFYILVCLIGKI